VGLFQKITLQTDNPVEWATALGPFRFPSLCPAPSLQFILFKGTPAPCKFESPFELPLSSNFVPLQQISLRHGKRGVSYKFFSNPDKPPLAQ
jgi:hypothetical protein